MTKIIT